MDNGDFISDLIVKEKSHIEPTHSKFCKYFLGLPKSASTTGVFSELNRYPLSIKTKINTLTCWHKLECEELRPVLLNSYLEYKSHKHPFYENISFELRRNGLGHIISDIHSYSRQYLKSVLLQNLTHQLKKEMNSIIATDEKLIYYGHAEIMTSYQMKPCISIK